MLLGGAKKQDRLLPVTLLFFWGRGRHYTDRWGGGYNITVFILLLLIFVYMDRYDRLISVQTFFGWVGRIIECRDVQGASIGDGRRQLVAKRSGSTPPSLATHPSVTKNSSRVEIRENVYSGWRKKTRRPICLNFFFFFFPVAV